LLVGRAELDGLKTTATHSEINLLQQRYMSFDYS